MDAISAEKKFKEAYGKKTSVALIGQSGENLSYLAGICNEHGRLAARSGVGAVMGSKRVKAVVVKSTRQMIQQHDKEARGLMKDSMNNFRGAAAGLLPQRRHDRHHGGLGAQRRPRRCATGAAWASRSSATWTACRGPVVNEKMVRHLRLLALPPGLRRRERGVGQPGVPVPAGSRTARSTRRWRRSGR